jgi:hypothetical protein
VRVSAVLAMTVNAYAVAMTILVILAGARRQCDRHADSTHNQRYAPHTSSRFAKSGSDRAGTAHLRAKHPRLANLPNRPYNLRIPPRATLASYFTTSLATSPPGSTVDHSLSSLMSSSSARRPRSTSRRTSS